MQPDSSRGSHPDHTVSVVGVDVGGTQVRAGLVVDGEVRQAVSYPTPAADGAHAVVETIIRAVSEVRSASTLGVGIAAAGVIDTSTGTVLAATDLIKDWAGAALGPKVSDALHLPVKVINDVHGHALGELHHGAARGCESVLLVAAGTGLGGALIIHGQVMTGAHQLAGHLGHVPCAEAAALVCSCGALGHLESVASGTGLEQLHHHLNCTSPAMGAPAITSAAEQGDPAATRTLRRSGAALGAAIGGWCNLLDPDAVIITGGLSQAGAMWWEALRQAHQRHALPGARSTPLMPAAHPHTAALVGATTLFTHAAV